MHPLRRSTDRPQETIRSWHRPILCIAAPWIIAGACLLFSGCCIAPNTVRTEVSHLSHLGQHFGGNQTHYGAEYAEIIARWQIHGAYVDLGQGYNLSPGMGTGWHDSCAGGLCGPRELTTVSVGYIWQVKP